MAGPGLLARRVEAAVRASARVAACDPDAVVAPRRRHGRPPARVASARRSAAWILGRRYGYDLVTVGRALGYVDHTGALRAIRAAETRPEETAAAWTAWRQLAGVLALGDAAPTCPRCGHRLEGMAT